MLRNPLLRYWASDFFASFGDGIRLAALPLLATRLTQSPLAIASVVAIQNLPWLFAPWVGVFVDRHNLRRLMIAAQAAQVAAIAALAVTVAAHACDLTLLYTATLITGISTVARITATQAGTARLVAQDDLDRINGRLGAGELIGFELAGPAIAGWLFGIAAALPLMVNAIGAGIAPLLLLSMPNVFRPVPPDPAEEDAPSTSLQELRAGLSWSARNRVVRSLVYTVAIVALVDSAWFAVLVLYVTRILHQGADLYGVLLAVGAIGGVAASPACGWLNNRLRNTNVLVAAVIIMAGTQLMLGLTSNVIVAAFMLTASSGASGIFNATAIGIRQRLVPARLLGRVSSAYLAVAGVCEALGALLGGILASSAGIRAPMLVGVVPLVAAALMLYVSLQPQGTTQSVT